MTDRELLELAAKAAGIELFWHSGWNLLVIERTHRAWNPLTDDGDALRLAVKLGIDLMHTNIHEPKVHAMADWEVEVVEDSIEDPYAATRRAIVRAAAEIGEGMK